ncbi:hypothetical protein BDW22DRAFT_1424934 [Trametopsis cervina]|nr:hypothetical protein BDW22DRAFT_1424934 [Trametopsis cervina]
MKVTFASAAAALLASLYAPQVAATGHRHAARQSSLHLYVVEGATVAGPLWVDDTNGSAKVNPPTSTSSETFSISSPTDFLYVSFPGSPHAYISFSNIGTSCGTSGPLVFTTSNSNKCSQQPQFEISNNSELIPSVQGSFQVCGTDKHLEFTKGAVSDGCTAARIVTQYWLA